MKKRTSNACIACRQSKIKCSGEEPCLHCQRRLLKCLYGGSVAVHSSRVAIAQDQVSGSSQDEIGRSSGTKRSRETAFGIKSGQNEHRCVSRAQNIWTSPFTLPSKTIINTHDNRQSWIWLAPSSPWSFTVRLTLMITEKLQLGGSPYYLPNFGETESYSLRWDVGSMAKSPPDVRGLPTIEDGRYLFDTVKFHLGQIYRLLDDKAFVANLQEFYAAGATTDYANENRQWFTQYLLVVALGRAILSHSRTKREPPGATFFQRAVALLPNQGSLWKDSLMAIDILALIGLYLYCTDHRESAHIYVCQAVRIAQLEGLHTQLPEDELGKDTVARCRNLWWSLYIMDRHFSTSLGLPALVQDEDITTLLTPTPSDSQQDSVLVLQVELWRHFSSIIRTVYKTQRTQLGQFLETTKSILHKLAGFAQQLEKIVHVDPQNSVGVMSKGIRHVILLYHMCVIFATRPLLLSILTELLELDHEMTAWRDLLYVASPVVTIGLKSAKKTLQILSEDDAALEHFLPFDLYCLCAAAIDLLIAEAIFPDSATIRDDAAPKAELIFNEMIQKGARVAEVRKAEYDFLRLILGEFAARMKAQELQLFAWPLAPTDAPLVTGTVSDIEFTQDVMADAQPSAIDITSTALMRPVSAPVVNTVPDLQNLPIPEFFDNMGISSDAFLSIVDQIEESSYDLFGIVNT